MTKNVQLSEMAYATLAAAKRGSESFSDAVLRLMRQPKDLDALLDLPPVDDGYPELLEKVGRRERQKLLRLHAGEE